MSTLPSRRVSDSASAAAVDRAGEPPCCSIVADEVDEVSHVLVPDVRRQGPDHGEIQLVEVDGVRAVDATLAGPQDDLSGVRVDQMPVLVVEVLVRQRERDLVEVEPLDLQHYSSVCAVPAQVTCLAVR
jgi:hypothetical protein